MGLEYEARLSPDRASSPPQVEWSARLNLSNTDAVVLVNWPGGLVGVPAVDGEAPVPGPGLLYFPLGHPTEILDQSAAGGELFRPSAQHYSIVPPAPAIIQREHRVFFGRARRNAARTPWNHPGRIIPPPKCLQTISLTA